MIQIYKFLTLKDNYWYGDSYNEQFYTQNTDIWHIPWLFLSGPAESQLADPPLAARIPWMPQPGAASGPVHPLPLEGPAVFQGHRQSSFANQQTEDSAYPTQFWPHLLAFAEV